MLEDYPLLLEINEKECNSYISNIEYKKRFSKIKTIFNIIYNSGLIIYHTIISKMIITSKNVDSCNGCCFAIFYFYQIIIVSGYFSELVLVSMILNYYKKT